MDREREQSRMAGHHAADERASRTPESERWPHQRIRRILPGMTLARSAFVCRPPLRTGKPFRVSERDPIGYKDDPRTQPTKVDFGERSASELRQQGCASERNQRLFDSDQLVAALGRTSMCQLSRLRRLPNLRVR